MRRQTFTAGEIVGSGFTVVDPTRIPMKKNTYGNTVWGIKVRCPLCGDEFDSTISKLDSYLGLSGTEALPRFVNLLPLWVGISTPPDGAQPLLVDVMEREDGSLRAAAEPEATG